MNYVLAYREIDSKVNLLEEAWQEKGEGLAKLKLLRRKLRQ